MTLDKDYSHTTKDFAFEFGEPATQRVFEDHKPARCIIPTRELHFGCLIEIKVKAIKL